MVETVLHGQALVWRVGSLCRAIADVLDARLNPVAVCGEISGFTRAASGHCYFSLKDEQGQLRCAMFRRAAGALPFVPRDGDLVEVRGRVGVYEPRGELQLVVESMTRAGQGTLFEQFLVLKAKLEAQGLFDAIRKRPLPAMPMCIGVVTSLGAAALHDVLTALNRRAPHVRVVIAPASVQGATAPAELIRALESLRSTDVQAVLLVRGGGSMEDLWAFNDEALAQAIAASPVPVIAGVGHETDFTIADFVADVRAPTPTAAAEIAATPTAIWMQGLEEHQAKLQRGVNRWLERAWQQHDTLAARIGRPSQRLHAQQLRLSNLEQQLHHGLRQTLLRHRAAHDRLEAQLISMGPQQVLQRGYALLTDSEGRAVSSAQSLQAGDFLQATLADGVVDLRVQGSV